MNQPPDSSSDASASVFDGLATLDLPLRGLASEGVEARIVPPLRAIPGVRDVTVLAAEFRVRVTYDPGQVPPETIRECLHGLAQPDTAHGAPAPRTGGVD